MYGMIPSANSENRPSAPPENMLNRPTIELCVPSNSSFSATGLMPGTGMYVPMR